MSEFKHWLSEIKWLNRDLTGKDFLLTRERSTAEIKQILCTAQALRHLHKKNIAAKCFSSGLAVSQFRDKSTRTRFSFSSAANLLGLTVQDLDEGKSQISHGETVRETANMISFLTEIIGIRDDLYLGVGHNYMKEVAAALDEGYKEGVLNQRPGIINLQSDLDHPTQSLSDLLHIENRFGSLENLQGKKIAMTWAYSPTYGKPLSVPQGIIALLTRFGMNVALAFPPGYDLVPGIVARAGQDAAGSGGGFTRVDSMAEAFSGADIVYPKSWAPYKIMEERTVLLKKNDPGGLQKLEQECLAQNANFKDWECDSEKMALTRNGSALYMHCLPADRGNEVTDAVIDGPQSVVYREAENRLHTGKAIMALTM